MSRITRAAAVVVLAAAPLLASAAPAAAGPLPECEIGMRPSMPPQLYYYCDPL